MSESFLIVIILNLYDSILFYITTDASEALLVRNAFPWANRFGEPADGVAGGLACGCDEYL
jgi:hypothetical protein